MEILVDALTALGYYHVPFLRATHPMPRAVAAVAFGELHTVVFLFSECSRGRMSMEFCAFCCFCSCIHCKRKAALHPRACIFLVTDRSLTIVLNKIYRKTTRTPRRRIRRSATRIA